jgi:hypothetical protein
MSKKCAFLFVFGFLFTSLVNGAAVRPELSNGYLESLVDAMESYRSDGLKNVMNPSVLDCFDDPDGKLFSFRARRDGRALLFSAFVTGQFSFGSELLRRAREAKNFEFCFAEDNNGHNFLFPAVARGNEEALKKGLKVFCELRPFCIENEDSSLDKARGFLESHRDRLGEEKATRMLEEIEKAELVEMSERLSFVDHIPGLGHPTEEELDQFVAGEESMDCR